MTTNKNCFLHTGCYSSVPNHFMSTAAEEMSMSLLCRQSCWLRLLHAHTHRVFVDRQDPSCVSQSSSYFMQKGQSPQGPPSISSSCELGFPAGKHKALSQDWATAHCAVAHPVSEHFPDSSSNFGLLAVCPFPGGIMQCVPGKDYAPWAIKLILRCFY